MEPNVARPINGMIPCGGRVWWCAVCGVYATADCACCEPPRCACQVIRPAAMIGGVAKRAPKRRPGRGGRRPGAGRKPVDGMGTQVVATSLTAKHVDKVERWADEHDAENFSDALRQIIDAAIPD